MSIAPASNVPGAQDPLVGVMPATVQRERVITANRLVAWGTKSVGSILDQALSSLTGFCVSFLLARWLAPEIFGAYAIAFAGYLVICGLHNVIILEPMSVLGPARYSDKLINYVSSQIAIHAILVSVLAAVVAPASLIVWRIEPASPLVGAILGSGLALPFLLLLWLARRICYVLQQPLIAILGSASCLVSVILGLYALHKVGRITPFITFVLMGAGGLLGSCVVLRRLGLGYLRTTSGEQMGWRVVLKENWSYGRWLVGSTVLYSITGQVQMFLAAALLGLGACGVLRAMSLPASAMTQVVTATGLLVLPSFAYDFGRGAIERIRQKAVLVSAVLGGAGLCFVALLALLAGHVDRLLFAGKYAGYAGLMAILALVPAANGFTMGYSASLRASQKPHLDLLANVIAAPVAVVSAMLFIHWWGLAGAAVSMVTGFAVSMGINCWIFYGSRQQSRGSLTEIDLASDGVRQ
jgi:O-antigen/teichoic acid export membrane protein